jgi:nitrate/TMAO reductase-like tetraheme cytochrome c subunit
VLGRGGPDYLSLTEHQVRAVLDYYADNTEKIDREAAEELAFADAAEAEWLREQAEKSAGA